MIRFNRIRHFAIMRPKVEPENKARTRGVSLTPEAYEAVMNRVASLTPFVKTFSAYFQLLAEIDQREGLVERELMRKLEEKRTGEPAERLPQVRKLRTREQHN